MQNKWLNAIAYVVLSAGGSGIAVAEQLGTKNIQSIRQCCDEMYGFSSSATYEEPPQVVNQCATDEVSRS